MKALAFIFVFNGISGNVFSQFIFKDSNKLENIPLFSVSQIANCKQKEISIDDILAQRVQLNFHSLQNENENLGFTTDHYWVHFELNNLSRNALSYYLETARPVTDHVDLYVIQEDRLIAVKHSGDNMRFNDRNIDHRKALFDITLPAKSNYKYYLHLKSDGEVLTLPLVLRSANDLLKITYLEQLVYGFFYGILLLAAIIYLFFYVGMRDRSFLNYSLYVVFIGLMQFSLDGYFYQYITPSGNWFSLHAVLIFASIAAFFLGRYTELFLNIPVYIPTVSKIFKIVYYGIGLLFILILAVPSFFPYAYPITNIFGMTVLMLIIGSIVFLYIKRLPIDKFFTIGILFLITGFVIFILNNFNLIPVTFLSQNSSKLGTGMEVIFISLSMANRIRKLREDREHLIVDLTVSNEDLKQFTYITSHDLRAPISNLIGLLSIYDKNNLTSKRNKDVIEKITESTKRLDDTLSDLINILLIKNNNSIEQTVIRFDDALQRTIYSIENSIIDSRAAINTNFTAAESIYFNKSYLESIFQNLLTNAIKYRLPDRPLRIDIKSRVKDQQVQLLFSDNGSGINMARHKDKIFGLHQRFHSNENSKGVGLYIIKSQIISLGGQINIESEENRGTTFIITFKKHLE